MEITGQRELEARQLMESISAEKWEALISILKPSEPAPTDGCNRPPSAADQLEAARERIRVEKLQLSERFRAWRKEVLKGYEVPYNWQPSYQTMATAVEYMDKIPCNRDAMLEVVCFMYEYGFKRGTNYGKKAASHAGHTKSGRAQNDEIQPAKAIHQ
jgi:hypothetical protein